jgi:hypothetical protein
VCLPDNEHATGTLEHKNLCYNIAVITIVGSRCTQTAKIYDQLQIEPHAKVAAVGRVYESGKLIATGGTLIDKPSELDCKELKLSTCKITKVCYINLYILNPLMFANTIFLYLLLLFLC